MKAEAITKSEKEHAVVLGKHEIGTSKTRFDADFHVNVINDALQVVYLEGVKAGMDLVGDADGRS